VVRRTGGLADTVTGQEDPQGTGFVFVEARSEAFLACMRRMEAAWGDARGWSRLQNRGMALRFDWQGAAARYEDLYNQALIRRAREMA